MASEGPNEEAEGPEPAGKAGAADAADGGRAGSIGEREEPEGKEKKGRAQPPGGGPKDSGAKGETSPGCGAGDREIVANAEEEGAAAGAVGDDDVRDSGGDDVRDSGGDDVRDTGGEEMAGSAGEEGAPSDFQDEGVAAFPAEGMEKAKGLFSRLRKKLIGDGAEEGREVKKPFFRAIADGLSEAMEFPIFPQPTSLDEDGEGGGISGDFRAVDNIFLISRHNILMNHYTSGRGDDMDPDILAGMLMAVQSFIGDSFESEKGSLSEMRYGGLTIILSRGEYVTIASVLKGSVPDGFRSQMDRAVSELEEDHRALVRDWEGDMEDLKPLDRYMKKLVSGGYDEP